MAIFGGAADSTMTIALPTVSSITLNRSNFVKFDRTIDKSDIKIHTSVLTGKRASILLGKYFGFKGTLLLTSYSSEAAKKSDYMTKLSQYVGANVTVSFSDFLDETDTAILIPCIMTKCEPFYWKEISFHDAFNIELISADYVDFPALMAEDGT